jgi:hypothetical protein
MIPAGSWAVLQNFLYPHGNALVDDNHLGFRQQDTPGEQGERRAGSMLGPEHRSFLQLEDFPDCQGERSQFELDAEGQLAEAL